jgi:membrane protein implicated in regulation of membrane protease activity
MESVYLISLIVGGFFVLLSIFGGDHEADTDHDLSFDTDHDLDFDLDVDTDTDLDIGADQDFGADAGPGFVDLLSIRALFLFAAFFGLTGVTLGAFGTEEPMNALLSTTTGMIIGLGGNWFIKRFAYQQVSSQVSSASLKGRTARVLLPMEGEQNGRIMIEAGGKKMQLTARLFEPDAADAVARGDEVVVLKIKGRIAEVIKPD